MEKEIKIKTTNKHYIYGTLAKSKKPSKKLIIFVHGFCGNQNEHIFFNGAKYFTGKGYDTFRFNLYSGEKGARKFRDIKISLHGKDTSTVIKYFSKDYEKIYVVGHSYGGTTLLFTDTKHVNTFVFWDASWIEWKDEDKDFPYRKDLDAHVLDWGIEYIVGKPFIEELKSFPDCGGLISKIKIPVKFITAGRKGKGNTKAGKKYFALANEPKDLVDIPTAEHNFNTFAEEERLFKETQDWMKRF